MYAKIVDDWEVKSLLNGYKLDKIRKINEISKVSNSGYILEIKNENSALIVLRNLVKRLVLPDIQALEFGSNLRIKELDENNYIGNLELLDISKVSTITDIDCLGLKEIGSLTKDGCIIRLNKDIKIIHCRAFIRASIKSINIDELENLEEIESGAFAEAHGIKEIALNNKLKRLGYGVFAGSDLEKLTIKSNMKFDWSSLAGARMLRTLDIKNCDLDKITNKEKIMLNKLDNIREIIVNKKYIQSLDMPEGIKLMEVN